MDDSDQSDTSAVLESIGEALKEEHEPLQVGEAISPDSLRYIEGDGSFRVRGRGGRQRRQSQRQSQRLRRQSQRLEEDRVQDGG